MSSPFTINKNGHCRLCTQADERENMVACDECDRWFHLSCAKLSHEPTREESWLGIKCDAIRDRFKRLEENQKPKDLVNPKEDKDEKTNIRSQQEVLNLQYEVMNRMWQHMNENKPSKPEGQDEPNWTTYLKRQVLMSLPKFDGSSKNWPRFIKIYEETSEEGEFSDIENLNRLQQVLVGNAAKSVQPLMLDSLNVPKILERLEQNFGRPEQIYKDLLNDFVKIKKNQKAVVIEICDALENMVENLKTIGKDDYLFDPRLVEETVRKLPYNLQVQWAELLVKNKKAPSLKDLGLWLKPHAATQRMLQLQLHSTEKREAKHRINVHH